MYLFFNTLNPEFQKYSQFTIIIVNIFNSISYVFKRVICRLL